MKNVLILLLLLLGSLVACSSEEVDQAVATLTAVDLNEVDVAEVAEQAAQILNDDVVVTDSIDVETSQPDYCNLADVPDPSDGKVMVRFVNISDADVAVFWNNVDNLNELLPYFELPNQNSHDQETFAGDEWVIKTLDDHALVSYEASDEPKQCALVFPHWAYEGEEGPAHWAELSDHYEQCGLGQHQSPIALTGDDVLANLTPIEINYQETPLHIINNGHTIEVKELHDSHIVLDGITYHLEQFHFHAPSEHTLDGNHYPMEMHLVHQAEDGKLAVIGIFIAEGEENSLFYPVWDFLPDQAIGTIETGTAVNPAMMLPDNQTVYQYSGSLTTPPCSENVTWLVMPDPVPLSADQISGFTDIINHNNRPTQPSENNNEG